ncbi:2-C-methyl-D-erythritol 4-phosphate cytidylyltransferase [Celerinatantimonas diazotrophica]|uniref:2-C-methyl-D-erythritol 4-phosphate cytidylyltransferase n=1 Tax=Celerinatantimonas diazotrophica TaxID=412034 RepID=A0A4R1J9U7_9GAMM|nr:2-C-methyl-D-erythritol 4-phosphate cytidylyltransferase [Celerinatantimonas diazotrophica]TCK47204.1 2-C-methyl-D-erythritol 4-phosphate cytidylyltransferase [Celerinatantimonas diazotrophica]CAG9295976.1 2-C-methyl-D-erythritol 4-phosphate cytidylyltransferase [Celerinatantimonas diazotrophica]
MNKPLSFTAVIPAAGIGQRMACDYPKQYLPINGQAMLSHSARLFIEHPAIERVVIALHPQDHWFAGLQIANHSKISTVIGGEQRVDSVLAALDVIDSTHWVLVHDAARPCLVKDDLDKLIARAELNQCAILASPVRDTMKCAMANHVIDHTVDRSRLWHAMTPQSFPCDKLRRVLRDALIGGVNVTDEASAMEWAGETVHLVVGRQDNLKVTHPEDLALAEFILARQKR